MTEFFDYIWDHPFFSIFMTLFMYGWCRLTFDSLFGDPDIRDRFGGGGAFD